MQILKLSLLLISNICFAQSPSITFPVQYEVNKQESGGNPIFGGMFFDATLNHGTLHVTRRTVILFGDKKLGGFERDDAFSTSELFLRESYFEHVIIKKRAIEDDFNVDFIKFVSFGGNRRCAQFVLNVKADPALRTLVACFDGETYVIRRIEEIVQIGNFSTNVKYDLVTTNP